MDSMNGHRWSQDRYAMDDPRRKLNTDGEREEGGCFEAHLAMGMSSSPSNIDSRLQAASYPDSYGTVPAWNHDPMGYGRLPSVNFGPPPPSLLSSIVAGLAQGVDPLQGNFPVMSGQVPYLHHRFQDAGKASSHAATYMAPDTSRCMASDLHQIHLVRQGTPLPDESAMMLHPLRCLLFQVAESRVEDGRQIPANKYRPIRWLVSLEESDDNTEGGKQQKRNWSSEEQVALVRYTREDDAMMVASPPRQKHQRRSLRNTWVVRRMKVDEYHRSAEDVQKKWADLHNKYRLQGDQGQVRWVWETGILGQVARGEEEGRIDIPFRRGVAGEMAWVEGKRSTMYDHTMTLWGPTREPWAAHRQKIRKAARSLAEQRRGRLLGTKAAVKTLRWGSLWRSPHTLCVTVSGMQRGLSHGLV
ncbi:hypothetical protein CBR_g45197 [Chara braunii]|uniref:Myb-like domain-containing protein n=1 Tax=Chara braunii TaxID=69332 RepID=A0A388K369_CHABU|nr:hypothetical protein CBR_g45197 [Chara braunii]|eukprot:GBG64501.1 hypothetical protein CBR_g45197 [Chara braunii]